MNITIIEDAPQFTSSLKLFLLQNGIEKTKVFSFVSEALIHTDPNLNVLILNYNLNGMISLDYIDYFRSHYPNVKIIFIVNNGKLEILARAKFLGADYFLIKDEFVFEKILTAIKNPLPKPIKLNRAQRTISLILRKKPMIYALDDDILFSSFIRFKLAQFPQFRIKYFNEIEDLMSATAKKQPDLLLLDYYLQNGNGNIVISRMKTIAPKAKIVMFSGQLDYEIGSSLFEAGIADYVVKNKDWEEAITTIIEKHLRLKLGTKAANRS